MYPGFYGESMCISDCAYTPLLFIQKRRKNVRFVRNEKESRSQNMQ